MKTWIIVLIVLIGIAFIVSLICFLLYRKNKKKKMLESIKNLDVRKNILDSKPVLVELSKIEEIAKNEQLEEKINEFKTRYEEIKTTKIVKINDMIVELDVLVEQRSVKEFYDQYANVEMEIEETEGSINKILEEIDEIASCEEKYRDIITKLKAKYRFLEKEFNDKESLLDELKDTIKMQFENIEKRFSDFDIIMEENLYNEFINEINDELLKKEFKDDPENVPKVNKEEYFYQEEVDYKVGDFVYHDVFGTGKIVEVTNTLMSIAFKHPHGIKKLMKNHKSIKKI